ncbi:hypothetical protein EBT16_09515 [bacterium]|nr:hypothetical protein [bacterium]
MNAACGSLGCHTVILPRTKTNVKHLCHKKFQKKIIDTMHKVCYTRHMENHTTTIQIDTVQLKKMIGMMDMMGCTLVNMKNPNSSFYMGEENEEIFENLSIRLAEIYGIIVSQTDINISHIKDAISMATTGKTVAENMIEEMFN